jgi:hypothetical protein
MDRRWLGSLDASRVTLNQVFRPQLATRLRYRLGGRALGHPACPEGRSQLQGHGAPTATTAGQIRGRRSIRAYGADDLLTHRVVRVGSQGRRE